VRTGLALQGASLVIVVASLALAGCGTLPDPANCSGPASCPTGSWCRSGMCAANTAPTAVIEPPVSARSNTPLRFGATGSRDDDPGDSIGGWSWRASPPPGASGCEPIPGKGASANFDVVFPCAGDHEVSLVVADSLGLASPARSVIVRVELSRDPPVLVTGPDVTVEHRCSGVPLTCGPWDGASPEVMLSARASAPAGVTFTYRWSVELPSELAAQPVPRVTFSPGDTSAEPRVRIETDGTAISGRYTFTVVATDSRGLVTGGSQRVVIGNRPPVVTGGGRVLLPHRFDAAARKFLAGGETPAATWTDPDGDPVTLAGFTSVQSGAGPGVFEVLGVGDRARLSISVPYSSPADGAFLLGPGVSRRAEIVVADVNGAHGTTGWDVEVTNRPPRLVSPVPFASVDHTFEASFQRYAAQAELSTWVDDDGDPLLLAVGGDPACADVLERGGTAWVTCSAPFTGRADLDRIVGIHSLAVSAADPFDQGPVQQTRLEVRNRPPRLVASRIAFPMTCAADPNRCCSGFDKWSCPDSDFDFIATSIPVRVAADDDGDPIDLSISSPPLWCLSIGSVPRPCTEPACIPVLTMCGLTSGCGATTPTGSFTATASDGLATVSGTVNVQGVCAP